ncbi:NUDIX domain-containing protein, partial [Bifidobacterium myosotis]|uniref:NUDIX domain-containing protein n=1 Tax=Bifidobacterium myosotis TaxID=1630166 RepID=UPI003B8380A8
MRGLRTTMLEGRLSMRLSAPADMVGTGVPLFRFYFLGGNKPYRRTPLSHPHTKKPRRRRRGPTPHHTNWRRLEFPRGMGEAGESPVQTAIREFREETGIAV